MEEPGMDKRWQSLGPEHRRAWLMARMMSRLGVTVAGASDAGLGMQLRWARIGCMSCRHANECEAWLSHSKTAFAADAPDFCPNGRLFRWLRTSTSR